MRIAVDILDPLYRDLRTRAAKEGCSIKELVLSSIQVRLKQPLVRKQERRRPPVIDSKEPGTLQIDNERIFDIIGLT